MCFFWESGLPCPSSKALLPVISLCVCHVSNLHADLHSKAFFLFYFPSPPVVVAEIYGLPCLGVFFFLNSTGTSLTEVQEHPRDAGWVGGGENPRRIEANKRSIWSNGDQELTQMNARHQTTTQGAEGTTTQLQLVDHIQTIQFKSLKRSQKKTSS